MVVNIVTIIALIIGPILAVIIGRFLESRRIERERRTDVFRTLMRTLGDRLSFDHVSALNLVTIEFQNDENVIEEWKKYLEYLHSGYQRRPDEIVSENHLTEAEKQDRNNRYNTRTFIESGKLLAKLLEAMAQSLNYKVEGLDIFQGGYSPQGWEHVESQQALIRQYFVDLYFGNKALPITVFNGRQSEVNRN